MQNMQNIKKSWNRLALEIMLQYLLYLLDNRDLPESVTRSEKMSIQDTASQVGYKRYAA